MLNLYLVLRDMTPETVNVVAIQLSEEQLRDQDFLAEMERHCGPCWDNLSEFLHDKFMEYVITNRELYTTYISPDGVHAYMFTEEPNPLN